MTDNSLFILLFSREQAVEFWQLCWHCGLGIINWLPVTKLFSLVSSNYDLFFTLFPWLFMRLALPVLSEPFTFIFSISQSFVVVDSSSSVISDSNRCYKGFYESHSRISSSEELDGRCGTKFDIQSKLTLFFYMLDQCKWSLRLILHVILLRDNWGIWPLSFLWNRLGLDPFITKNYKLSNKATLSFIALIEL